MILKRFKKIRENKSGVVLVMALIMASVMLASVLILTTALTQEVKVSLNTNNAVVSYYVAETGIEKALHRIKYGRETGNFDYYEDLETYDDLIIDPDKIVSIPSSAISTVDYTSYNITTSTPDTLDIISPAGNLSAISLGGADYYDVVWEIDQCFDDGHGSDRLEIKASIFDQNFSNPDTFTDLAVCDCSFGSDVCSTYGTLHNILNDRYYRFSFRPLDSTIDKLTFSLYDDTGQKIGILSEATVQADGVFSRSQYHLEARIPSLSQLSDIFSFVIFTEESLIKDIP